MKLKSIRWRLPLTYAGIALITALVLGVTLLFILRDYYQAQEGAYLKKNAVAISEAIIPLLSQGQPPSELKDHLMLFSFLSQTHLRLLDANGNELADFNFSGGKDSSLVASAISLPAPGNLEASPGPASQSGTLSASPSPNGKAVINLQFGLPLPEGATLATASPSAQGGNMKFFVINKSSAGSSVQVSGQVEGNGPALVSVFPVAGTMFGFDLQGSGTIVQTRSTQVYTQALVSTEGKLLGSITLSEGPAYGLDIVLGVARGWAVASLVALLIAALAGWWVSRRMSAPLLVLTDGTRRMASGDLSARVAVAQQDEFGLLAASFNRMAEQVEDTVLMLKRFASDAAHELRTPLTALHTYLELAGEEQAAGAVPVQSLEQALEQVKRLETLTNDLLDLSRIESGANGAPLEDIELCALLREASEPYASQAEQSETAFTLELPEGEVRLQGHSAQLRRALGNLLGNALKFTPPGGSVSVRLVEEGGQARLSVEDSGIGVPEEDLPYLFNRFHRGRNATAYPGSGLGLAIVKAIAQAHGGGVSAENTPTGARFTLRLPVEKTPYL